MARYYRENRYGERINVENRCCGNYKNYDIDYGKCEHYIDYFTKDDSCSGYYSMADDVIAF